MAKDIYIGVNNVAQKVKKAYVGVNGVAKEVKSIYVGVNGVARNAYSGAINPDDYFDPSTHIATEANFIAFLEAGGKYDDKSLVGYKIQLSNSVDYNNGLWVIADVNHDSANTEQENCYDLISQDCFYNVTFNSTNWNSWRDSTPRTWLNNTFYPGFSTEFKNHILNPKYNSQGTWYDDDKIIIPSKVEVNEGIDSDTDNEGVAYPIFTADYNSKKKYQVGTTTYRGWWTRSRDVSSRNYVWQVTAQGYALKTSYRIFNTYLAPILRIS